MSHKALVCRISGLRPIPDADRIQLATVGNYQVVVGRDVQEGTLGVFFTSELQLSEEFAQVHDLVERKDKDGNRAGGFFKENRRVKAIRLKGCKSEGYWCPASSFSYTGYELEELHEGDEFDELNGHSICAKYITPATRQHMASGKNNRSETPMFLRHVETEALKRNLKMIPKGAMIVITEKCHGTSGRLGYVLDEVEIRRRPVASFFAKLLRRPTSRREWTMLNGSRNVILEHRADGEQGYHGREDFRHRATKDIRLKKGEVLYFELVGYTETGAPIMAPQLTIDLRDKAIEKQFGKEITYRYGTIPGQAELLVYRIVQVNEDGHAVELSWNQCVARAQDLGLKTVPVLDSFIFDGDYNALLAKVDLMVNGADGCSAFPSTIDPSHIQEGVVLRCESPAGTQFYKHKSWVFGVLEGYLKEQNDVLDLEEAS